MARYALVIGISQYCSPLKSLEKTATDAEAVAQVLEEYGEFVEVKRFPSRRNPQTQKREVVAKAVTGAELGQALQTLLLEQARQNEALIYFTGHGIIVSGNLGQPRGYLATSDCEIEADGQRIISQKHGIGFDDLNDLISKSELSSLVVLLDCCHSGDFLERNLIDRSFSAFRSQQKDYYLITAGRSFQPVYARKNEKHSVFTGALLRGLAAENANSERRVSGDRLFDYITQELRGTEQEPLRLGWGKSLTLVTHPPLVAPPTVEVIGTTAVNRENPYLGLRSFDSGQANYFFGRILAVRALLDRLNTGRFLAVIGPSGCGKSSLVKAGLLPYLKDDHISGSNQWTVESFTPSTHPLESLQKALEQQNQPLLLFIDQFEEVFTLCEDEAERKDFISRITEEVTSSEQFTRVIIAMRGDFLDRCAAYQEAAVLINRTQPTTYFVTPFTLPELEEVIEKPADKHGVTFERGLVPQIIADVMNQPGGLPLLQYALAELWRVCITESSSPESQLTCKGYEQIRGVKGALEKRANDLYQNLAPADKVFVRRLFLSLVQLGEAKEVTRRRASWQDLEVEADSQEQLSRVTRQLASQEQRLIITDEKTVEVAHEALLSEWGRLKEWIEQDRENLRLSRRLEAECREWQRNDCSEGLLLTDAWLAAINDWVEKTQPRLSQLEQDFLQNSLEKRDRELQAKVDQERQLREAAEARVIAEIEKSLEAEARAKAEADKAEEARARAKAESQRTKLAFRTGVLLAVLAASTSGFAMWATAESSRATRNEINALTESATTLFESNNQLEAMIENVKALRKLQGKQRLAPVALQQLVSKVHERHRFLEEHNNDVVEVSFSSDGEFVASASIDRNVRVWDKQGRFIRDITGHRNGVWSVSFSPDNQLIASADADGIIRISTLSGIFKRELKPPKLTDDDAVLKIDFSPNSKMIASANWDKTIKLWRIDNGKILKTFKGHKMPVYGVKFSNNGQIVASASWDKTIKFWNVSDGSLVKTLEGHKDAVYDISFSSDDKMLASASRDRTIKLWRVSDGKLLKTLEGHSDLIYGVSFSHDQKVVASASGDQSIKIWRVVDGKMINTFKGHKAAINSISFSPDDKIIASASDDRSVRLWNVNESFFTNNEVTAILESSCNWLSDYLGVSKTSIFNKLTQEDLQVCDKID